MCRIPGNSREDGHLTASASSSGSACAIAAYKWLEFTVGSDTRSSVRKPAGLVGAYWVRPSIGSMILRGVVPFSEMDTAGCPGETPDTHTIRLGSLVGSSSLARICAGSESFSIFGALMTKPSKVSSPLEPADFRIESKTPKSVWPIQNPRKE